MKRLSDALEVLPKTIQEMIVNRLIDSITSGLVAQPKEDDTSDQVPPSLAAATLAALLHPKTTNTLIPVHA